MTGFRCYFVQISLIRDFVSVKRNWTLPVRTATFELFFVSMTSYGGHWDSKRASPSLLSKYNPPLGWFDRLEVSISIINNPYFSRPDLCISEVTDQYNAVFSFSCYSKNLHILLFWEFFEAHRADPRQAKDRAHTKRNEKALRHEKRAVCCCFVSETSF